ncbi:MAG: hypothetical protein HQM14_01540 [SAR324 cluster bacterium]|nr:hypothetical protein [SAR324 cluster bacterium]
MRVDFYFTNDEIYTATITRNAENFDAICGEICSKGPSIAEAVDNLKINLKRHFIKLRCCSAIQTAQARPLLQVS